MKAKGDAPSRGRERLPGIFIEIDHLSPARPEQGAETELGSEIGFHRAVIVQMITGEIGENPSRKEDSIEAALVETVRRCLHDDVLNASGHQLGQGTLQVDRAGRRE
jgi:hypothetical protein